MGWAINKLEPALPEMCPCNENLSVRGGYGRIEVDSTSFRLNLGRNSVRSLLLLTEQHPDRRSSISMPACEMPKAINADRSKRIMPLPIAIGELKAVALGYSMYRL